MNGVKKRLTVECGKVADRGADANPFLDQESSSKLTRFDMRVSAAPSCIVKSDISRNFLTTAHPARPDVHAPVNEPMEHDSRDVVDFPIWGLLSKEYSSAKTANYRQID